MQFQRISWEVVAVGVGLTIVAGVLVDKATSSNHSHRSAEERHEVVHVDHKAPPTPPKPPTRVKVVTSSNSDSKTRFEFHTDNNDNIVIDLEGLKELENMDFSGLKNLENLEGLKELKKLEALKGLQKMGDLEKRVRIIKDGVESNAELESLLVEHGLSGELDLVFKNLEGALNKVGENEPVIVETKGNTLHIRTAKSSNSSSASTTGSAFVERSFSSDNFKDLVFKTDGGHVFITGADVDEVKVRVEPNKKSISKEDLEKDMEIAYTTTDSYFSVVINKKDRGWGGSSNYGVNIYATVPNGKNINAHTDGGHIEISNVLGNTVISTGGGHITLKDTRGDFEINTSGGHINASNISGNGKLITQGGHINVENSSGDLVAHTYGGHINIEGNAGKIDATTNGGNINAEFASVNDNLKLHTKAGNVFLRVPKNLGMDVDLRGLAVDVQGATTRNSNGSPTEVRKSFNGGGVRIEAATNIGKVKVAYN